MTSKPLVFLGIIIVLIALIAAAGYFVNGPAHPGQDLPMPPAVSGDGEPAATPPVPTATSTAATTTPAGPVGTPLATSTLAIPSPASSTLNISSWHLYVDPQNRYSVEHPANLVEGGTSNEFLLAFPKNAYFHWPLLDDAKVTLSVAAACPVVEAGYQAYPQTSFDLGGVRWKRSVGTDVAAGNRYLEIAYDAEKDGKCYHIDFLDHGSNGAGLYVDDAALVRKYDAEHDKDLANVLTVLAAMVKSFRILAPAQ